MSDKEQQETEQSGWLREAGLWLKEQWHRIRIFLGVPVIAISYCICSPYLSPERRAANNDHTHLGWYLIGLAVIGGVACIPRVITSNPKKYFITRVLVTGITGGVFALLLPIAVKSTTTGVGGLRHSILLATGGLLAILTLGETRRKNDIDKRKNKQEKKKNDKDHRRQVRAGRRERYTKAVEQLGDEKAPIRMGGVYTLVGLIDEWLEDESIKKYEDRLKEGQVIINNLCAYIRSPFTLASYYDKLSKPSPTPKGIYKGKKEKFYADKATLKSEADVRLSIIKEIHDRLQGPEENTPGTWSDFEYDFSRSIFFYPVNFRNSKYNKPVNFSGSIYYEEVSFSNSDYYNTANLYGLTCHKSASFNDSIYYGDAYLGGKFKIQSDFSESTYHKNIKFAGYYKNTADFRESIYCNEVSFRGIHEMEADFTDSIYHKSIFNIKCCEESKFIGSIFSEELSTVYSEGYQEFPSSFINEPPQFYNNKKFTLFGSPNNDFYVNNHRNKINIEKK